MNNEQLMVKEFHDRFGVECQDIPQIPSEGVCDLRIALIEEEFEELKSAIEMGNLVEIADALADLKYVIDGAGLAFGIDLEPVFREVHRSNMSKVWPDGSVHRREDGKVIKPASYSPANIATVLGDQLLRTFPH